MRWALRAGRAQAGRSTRSNLRAVIDLHGGGYYPVCCQLRSLPDAETERVPDKVREFWISCGLRQLASSQRALDFLSGVFRDLKHDRRAVYGG